jgi:Reverse transcriptase (RNA-dependent DNA polymerase)
MASPKASFWSEATDAEMANHAAMGTWELVVRPKHARVLRSMWVFKTKHGASGAEQHKARIVVKGCGQRPGIDFDEVFAPTSKLSTLRMLLAVAASGGWALRQVDFVSAFLNGELGEDEEVYMEQPEGYVQDPNLVCRLRKSLYGLHQAPRAWHAKLSSTLQGMGFKASYADPSLYTKQTSSGPLHLLVWVDDILMVAPDEAPINAAVKQLQGMFKLRDLGQPAQFLGMQLRRDSSGSIYLGQSSMISELLERYGMADANPRSVPMDPGTKLVKAAPGEELDQSQYPFASLVGSLLYLAICTRPDIAFAVGALTRHMARPTYEHWLAAKAVLRYLAGTCYVGLTYGGTGGDLSLLGWSDADYAGDVNTRRSTTAYVFMCNGGAISWASRLQPTVATATLEAEYQAAAAATKEALWLNQLRRDLGLEAGTVSIYADNQGALKLMANPMTSPLSKHIDVLHHFVRERVLLGHVAFTYVDTEAMLADILTKPLAMVKFRRHVQELGLQASVNGASDGRKGGKPP